MNLVQAGRRLTVKTSLGPDALLVDSLVGVEALSQPFQFDVQLLSTDEAISFDSVVGKSITLTFIQADGSERYWNGVVSRFSQGPRERLATRYYATVVPWLWLLTRTADCRIFQKKKVPDILEQIFTDLGFKKSDDFEMRLYGSFVERDYCVQYRETDFNFVSRLMEEEGIYYFFSHEQDKHTLILTNDPAGHKPCPAQSKFRFIPNPGQNRQEDSITEWTKIQEFRPESYSVTDYNFETPSSSLAVSVPGRKKFDIYDYPGEYLKRDEGDTLARVRMQEQTSRGVVIQGASDCRAFTTGYSFELTDHYRQEFNGQYVLTGVRHSANQGGYGANSNGAGTDISYSNTFECIPAAVTHRPLRTTPRPVVQGCQTAVVVGPGGEEIFTDKYGRVKVQFHWDREGKRNENSSCWIRVSQPWAGKGWGSVAIPRIGQEVVVDFLEGNPDCPIIIGRVYNAEAMPPYGLPAGGMVSGFKSNSTKGGGGYNEISADDTKGKEKVTIHGQYDMNTTVEHDQTTVVHNCQSETIDVDKKSTVGSNKTIQVGGSHTETITGDKALTVGGSHTESIGSIMSQTVGAASAETVALAKALTIGAGYQVTVGAAMNETIGGLKAEEIGAAKVVMVGAASKELVGGSKSVSAGGKVSTKAGGSISEKAGSKIAMAAGSNIAAAAGGKMSLSSRGQFSAKGNAKGVIDMGSQLTLKCGGASITLKSGGDILIKGTNVKVKGSSKVGVDGSGGVKIKGAKIAEN